MKALWLENNQLALRAVPEPAVPGEALIRVRKAGVCSTDLEMVAGYYPFTGIPGHEFVGEVVAAPSLAHPEIRMDSSIDHPEPLSQIGERAPETGGGLKVGQRVVGEINTSCGRCEQCQGGRSTHCENRTTLGLIKRDGSFAEFTSLPISNLHLVPDSVPDELAVFTEPLAAALEIQEQVHIRPTDRILVVGAGRLGQLVAQSLALTGCDLHVLARHESQKKILAGRGIKLTSEGAIQPWRWDVVVEATGSPDGFSIARRAVRPRGTLVMKSTYKGEMGVNFSSIVVDEVNIVGSRCGPFEPALRLLEKREVDPSPLIAAQYGLGDALAAFEHAGQAGVLKILFEP